MELLTAVEVTALSAGAEGAWGIKSDDASDFVRAVEALIAFKLPTWYHPDPGECSSNLASYWADQHDEEHSNA